MPTQLNTRQLALAAAITATLSPAYAQTDASAEGAAPRIEEVLVTARKKEESLQDVPVAVTALSGDLLSSVEARGLEDIARLTPGFSFERANGSLAQPVIRGQAQPRLTSPVQNVATYLNGIYLQRSYQVDSDLLALQRVEIIKGPQSALFGRNAFSGAINYVTRKPDVDEFNIKVEGTIGNYDREELKGYISIPIAGIAGISLAASTSEFDGTWENDNVASESLSGLPTEGNLGGSETDSQLLQFTLAPNDELEINGFWNHREILIENPASYAQSTMSAIREGNTNNCYPFEDIAAVINPYLNGTMGLYCGELSTQPELAEGESRPAGILADRRGVGNDGETDVYGLEVNYQFTDELSGSYQYGKTEADSFNMGTLSGDPVNGTYLGGTLFDSRGNGTIESDSHDMRLEWQGDSLRVMGGMFYSSVEDYDYGASYVFTPNTDTPINPELFPVGNTVPPGFSSSTREETVDAVYALVSYSFDNSVTLTLEGRYTVETIEQQAADYYTGAPVGEEFSEDFEYFTPRATVDYQFSDNMMAYASVARGVKSGGFNTRAILPEEQVYDPETNWTYELGLKGSLLDNRLVFDSAIFYTDWSDMQGSRAQTDAVIGTPLIIGNVDGAEIMGLELSTQYALTDSIDLFFGAAVADGEYKDGAEEPVIARALCQNPAYLPPGTPACPYLDQTDIGGNQIARAPKYQANAGISYETALGEVMGMNVNFFARADYSYQSKQYADPTNTAYVPDRSLVNGSFGLSSDAWTLRFWGKNLLDEEYSSFVFATFAPLGQGSGVTYSPLLGDLRTYGATFSYEF